MKRSLLNIPCLTVLFTLAFWAGCASQSQHGGWHPESKEEMRNLIGQTVIDAAHQYNKALAERAKRLQGTTPRLEPKPL
jgi:hypothetical protein